MNDAIDIRKYLHTRRDGYSRPEVELPDWLPQNGLLYYDDLTEYRIRALTGQAYYRIDSAGPDPNPAITYVNLKGKSCMYKAEALNSVQIRLPYAATQRTFGYWACDYLQTCTNQQVMNIGADEGTIMLNFRNTNVKASIGQWRDGAVDYIQTNTVAPDGEWHFMTGRQLADRWELFVDGTRVNKQVMHEPDHVKSITLLTSNCFGVGVRCAFYYQRALDNNEITAIYNGSKNHVGSTASATLVEDIYGNHNT